MYRLSQSYSAFTRAFDVKEVLSAVWRTRALLAVAGRHYPLHSSLCMTLFPAKPPAHGGNGITFTEPDNINFPPLLQIKTPTPYPKRHERHPPQPSSRHTITHHRRPSPPPTPTASATPFTHPPRPHPRPRPPHHPPQPHPPRTAPHRTAPHSQPAREAGSTGSSRVTHSLGEISRSRQPHSTAQHSSSRDRSSSALRKQTAAGRTSMGRSFRSGFLVRVGGRGQVQRQRRPEFARRIWWGAFFG